MSTAETVQVRNQALARTINDEVRNDPQSPYAGKFVGIANGQVAAVADDLDELVEQLSRIEPDPSKTFCFEAGFDYDQPQYIWEWH